MTTPSVKKLGARLRKFPPQERAIITAYCLIYDATETKCCEAFRRVALAGVSILIPHMREQ